MQSNSLWTRRDALGILGAAGLGIFAAGAAKPVRFQKDAIIRSMLGDLSPEALGGGATLFHEHLNQHTTIPNSGLKRLEDVDNMTAEVRYAGTRGVTCMVDAGHPDMGRDLSQLRQIATANDPRSHGGSGVHIVASGGYYLQRAYPPEIATMSADQIADQLVVDAHRDGLGAFGEIGQSAQMTEDERKVFIAVGKAHLRTGLPIYTHNAYTGMRPQPNPPIARDSALRQLDVLESAGVKPQHIAIGHVCCLDDPKGEISQQLARRGAFVGFDRVVASQILPVAMRVTMSLALIEAGYASQLLLSSDFNGDNMHKDGGQGLSETVTVFGPMLRQAGVSEDTLHMILVDNPRRFLAFVPKKMPA